MALNRLVMSDRLEHLPAGPAIDTFISVYRSMPLSESDLVLARVINDIQSRLPRFDHLLNVARAATYLGIDKATFHSIRNLQRGTLNLVLGASLLPRSEIKCGDFCLTIEPKALNEKFPEAVWCVRIKDNENRQAARLGVNFHLQGEQCVASIVVINGTNFQVLNELKEQLGVDRPWSVAAIQALQTALPETVTIYRGIPSAQHPARQRQGFDMDRAWNVYDRTFSQSEFFRVYNQAGEIEYYEKHPLRSSGWGCSF